MGWAFGQNKDGRDVGYGVEATCDQDGCDEKIDRGLDYACGGLDAVTGDVEHGCGGYFCAGHLSYTRAGGQPTQLCDGCLATSPDEDDEGQADG